MIYATDYIHDEIKDNSKCITGNISSFRVAVTTGGVNRGRCF